MGLDPRVSKTVLSTIALTYLVEQAGGSVTVHAADYEQIVAKYGGTARMNLRFEVIKVESSDHARGVRVTLEQKAPGNAELVS